MSNKNRECMDQAGFAELAKTPGHIVMLGGCIDITTPTGGYVLVMGGEARVQGHTGVHAFGDARVIVCDGASRVWAHGRCLVLVEDGVLTADDEVEVLAIGGEVVAHDSVLVRACPGVSVLAHGASVVMREQSTGVLRSYFGDLSTIHFSARAKPIVACPAQPSLF